MYFNTIKNFLKEEKKNLEKNQSPCSLDFEVKLVLNEKP